MSIFAAAIEVVKISKEDAFKQYIAYHEGWGAYKNYKNNKDKFPAGYLVALTTKEWSVLRSKISTTNFSKTRVPPKAFTEKRIVVYSKIKRIFSPFLFINVSS